MELQPSRRLLGLLYLAGGLILADQLADLTATLLANPPLPATTSWRFGTFGLVMSRASVFLMADVLIFAGALSLGHRTMVRALGIIHLVFAPALLAGLGMFALDWLQVRGQVGEQGRRAFDLAALRAAGLGFLGAVIAGWGGLAAFRAARVSKPKGGRRQDGPLLMDIRRDEGSSPPG